MSRHTFFFALFLLYSLSLHAQGSFPVWVQPVLTPPYSLRLSDYGYMGSQKLVINLRVNDVTVSNLPIRFHIRMETIDGRGIETASNTAIVPVYLGGGEVRAFFGDDLAPYFNIDNLVFKGYTKEQYRRTGQLPEGFYRIIVEARHFPTGRIISNQGTAIGWFALGKPATLTYPADGAESGQIPGAPLTFSWQPNNVGIPGTSIQHTFQMWEMRVPGINPNVIAASMPPFYSATQFHNTLVMQPSALNLEPGMRYAWRVTSSDVAGNVPFENEGHSEVRTFTYLCKCDDISNLAVTTKGTAASFTWDAAPRHSSYIVEAENPSAGIFRSYRVYNNQYTLNGLEYDTKYRLRVRPVCNNNEMNPGDFTPWKKVEIPAPRSLAADCPKCTCEISDKPAYTLTNFTLRGNLQPGDTIIDDRTRLIIVSAIPSGSNTYKGQLLIWWRFYGVKFLANYRNLQVNTDNQVANPMDFEFESVNDPSLIVNVDKVMDALEPNDITTSVDHLQDLADNGKLTKDALDSLKTAIDRQITTAMEQASDSAQISLKKGLDKTNDLIDQYMDQLATGTPVENPAEQVNEIKKEIAEAKTKQDKKEIFTVELLKQIFFNGNEAFIEQSYPYLKKYMAKFSINTSLRVSYFLSQIGIEIDYFTSKKTLKENMNYNVCNIKRNLCQKCYSGCNTKCDDCKKEDCTDYKNAIYNKNRFDMCENPENYARNPEKIATAAYNGFIGRGFIHLTGEANYKIIYNYLVSKSCTPKPFLTDPSYLSDDLETAAMSACAFFEKNQANMLADHDNFEGVMNIVNKNDTNKQKRRDLLAKIKQIMNL